MNQMKNTKTYLDLLPDDVLQIIWIKVNANVIEELKNKPKNPNKKYSIGGNIADPPLLCINYKVVNSYNVKRYKTIDYENSLLSKQKDKNTITGLFGFVIIEFENNLQLQEYLSKECRKNIIKKKEYYIDCLKENNIKVKSNKKKLDMIKMLIKL